MANKDAYYFSHDCNARNDEKVLALRMKLGWEGYGLYWAIIEKLREAKDYELSMDFNLISFDLRTDNQKIKSIVTGFGLFSIDEENSVFYSHSLKNRMIFKEAKSKKASEAAKKRWRQEKDLKKIKVVDSVDVNAELMQTHSETNASKVKKSKLTPLPPLREVYDSDNFLKNWNELRSHYLKTPSHLNKLYIEDEDLFRAQQNDFTKAQWQSALKGLFKQENIPRKVMHFKPKHFLENVAQYLDAELNKEYKLYA